MKLQSRRRRRSGPILGIGQKAIALLIGSGRLYQKVQ